MENKFTYIKERVLEIAEIKGIPKEKFFENISMTYGNFKGSAKKTPLNSDAIANILTIYPDISPIWLLTGKGGMLNSTLPSISPESALELSLEKQSQLIPYYDVDFAAGAVEMYNDPAQVSYYLDVPEFNGCTAFKVYGDSMYPKIANGTMVFAKKLDSWHEHIEYGRIYGVVCKDGQKFIKYLRKNKTDPKNSFLLASENENYDDFEMKLTKIHNIWMIHGWVVKVV